MRVREKSIYNKRIELVNQMTVEGKMKALV